MTRLEPTKETIKKLFGLSNCQCAFPNCNQKLIISSGVIGEICHIEAAETGGPRYNLHSDDEQRRSFDNFLLLCPTHHTVIDTDEKKYTVEVLRKMKRKHEQNHRKTFNVSDPQINAIAKKFMMQVNVIDSSVKIDGGIINSTINISPQNEIKVLKTKSLESNKFELNNEIEIILKKIGKEKISILLQESKSIAMKTKDKQMQEWIQNELEGYVSSFTTAKVRDDIPKEIPDCRRIFSKLMVDFGTNGINEFKKGMVMVRDIKNIEDSLEKFKKGVNVQMWVQHTFDKDVPLLAGKTGNLLIPEDQLQQIITCTEQRLSKFLESHIVF